MMQFRENTWQIIEPEKLLQPNCLFHKIILIRLIDRIRAYQISPARKVLLTSGT